MTLTWAARCSTARAWLKTLASRTCGSFTCQLHLIGAGLLDELRARGFPVSAGDMGENVLTRGLDLLSLPRGARLYLGSAASGQEAVAEVTGLRNPCAQLDGLHPGLMAAVLGRDEHGKLIRRAGIMAVILGGR